MHDFYYALSNAVSFISSTLKRLSRLDRLTCDIQRGFNCGDESVEREIRYSDSEYYMYRESFRRKGPRKD